MYDIIRSVVGLGVANEMSKKWAIPVVPPLSEPCGRHKISLDISDVRIEVMFAMNFYSNSKEFISTECMTIV